MDRVRVMVKKLTEFRLKEAYFLKRLEGERENKQKKHNREFA